MVRYFVIFLKITKNQPCFARFDFKENQLTAGSVFKGIFDWSGFPWDFSLKKQEF